MESKKGNDDTASIEATQRNKEDLDAHFKETVTRAVTKLVVKEVVEKPTMDDENKTFRTRLVAFWMLTNAALAVSVENINGLPSNNQAENDAEIHAKQNIYFTIILFSTFGLALVRFIGVSSPLPALSFLVAHQGVLVFVLLLQAQSLQVLQEELELCKCRGGG